MSVTKRIYTCCNFSNIFTKNARGWEGDSTKRFYKCKRFYKEKEDGGWKEKEERVRSRKRGGGGPKELKVMPFRVMKQSKLQELPGTNELKTHNGADCDLPVWKTIFDDKGDEDKMMTLN